MGALTKSHGDAGGLYLVLVRFAGFEFYRFGRFDLDSLSGLRVSTRACLAFCYGKAAESRELNAAFLGPLLDILQNGVYSRT